MDSFSYPIDSLIPNPCLLAILFTISTHTGPEFVFHYPPTPDKHDYKAASFKATWQEFSSTNSLSSSNSSDDSAASSTDGLSSDSNSSDSENQVSDDLNEPDIPNIYVKESFESFMDYFGLKNDQNETTTSIRDHKSSHKDNRSNKPKLTHTERNPLSPFLKKVVDDVEKLSVSKDYNRSGAWTSDLKSGQPMESNNKYSSKGIGPNDSHSRVESKLVSSTSGVTVSSGEKRDKSSEIVLGFKTDYLSKLLSPPLNMCNTQFELAVDDMVFLGMPIHIRDGLWLKRKRRQAEKGGSLKKTSISNAAAHSSTFYHNDSQKNNGDTAEVTMPNELSPELVDSEDIYYSKSSQRTSGLIGVDFGKQLPSKNDFGYHETKIEMDGIPSNENYKSSEHKSTMKMFNVSFVVNPPVREYSERITQFYQCIATKFSKKLRYEQAKSNYVWKEVSKILEARENSRENGHSSVQCWDNIASSSSLAVVIAQLFTAISKNEIAKFTLNGKQHSLQIPIITQIPFIPPISQKVYLGTELSTLPPFNTLDENEDRNIENLALLLLDEPGNIIRDFGLSPDSPIALLLYTISPTKSISQLSIKSGCTTVSLLDLAARLIYWRRARTIFPVSSNNIYIVSPLAPMSQLYKFSRFFRQRFPNLPSLPELLSAVSSDGAFENIFGSNIRRDKRKIQLEAIGWMIKYGFLTLIQTFIMIKITPFIKQLVNRDIESKIQKDLGQIQEEIKPTRSLVPDLIDPLSHHQENNPESNTYLSKLHNDFEDYDGGKNSQSSPAMLIPTTSQSIFNYGSSGSYLKGSILGNNNVPQSVPNEEYNTAAIAEEWADDTIILDPRGASPLQMKWISKMLENKAAENIKNFRKLMKYMNGKTSMEWGLVRENLLVEDLDRLITEFKEFFVITKHW